MNNTCKTKRSKINDSKIILKNILKTDSPQISTQKLECMKNLSTIYNLTAVRLGTYIIKLCKKKTLFIFLRI